MTSPSINIDIYDAATAAETTYAVYGPSIWPAGATGNNVKPAVTATHTFTSGASGATTTPVTQPGTTVATTPTTTPTTVASKTTSAAATSSAGSGACAAAKYAQCGGIGFSGCTTCASGSSCSVVSDIHLSCHESTVADLKNRQTITTLNVYKEVLGMALKVGGRCI
jgi:hypothetical protein